MKNKVTYLIALILLAAACTSEEIGNDTHTLSGDGTNTPLTVTALLDAGGASTRAADKAFDNDDALLAYLRHVTWDGGTGARTLVSVDLSPLLVTFTKGSAGMTAYDGSDITPIGLTTPLGLTNTNTQQTSDLTAAPVLYWDDFSANSADDNTVNSKNLREDGHYLQSYYGYCFNGGEGSDNAQGATVKEHITAALTQATGTLGWKVSTDQKTKSDFKKSDLLWSAEQRPVPYVHLADNGQKDHGTILLPYTHAMSKVTVKITVTDGFATDYNLTGVETTLHNMFTQCTCSAPTYTLSAKGTPAGTEKVDNIQMWQGSTATAMECTYEAIVVPSILTIGNDFATITNLDGDTYKVYVTPAMLQVATEANGNTGWGAQLDLTDEFIDNGEAQARPLETRATSQIEQGKGYEMRSGVNYILNVRISKQGLTVSATIKDWENIEAVGKGEISFEPNVPEKGTIADELKAAGIKIYKNSVNTSFTDVTTTLTWNTTENKWDYDPVLYWMNKDDKAYFRAISIIPADGVIAQNNDVLWAFACDNEADFTKVGTASEVKITPRTGDVPLRFEHAMSKISFTLKTADGDYRQATSPAVNLSGATIEISNLATTGAINLVNGAITPGDNVVNPIGPAATVKNLPVIPQSIGDDAIIKITLNDGTVYKLKLNQCKVQTGTDPISGEPTYAPITAWERGKHYTYTINIEKEAITFRALIKEWEDKEGSGNATLEWD